MLSLYSCCNYPQFNEYIRSADAKFMGISPHKYLALPFWEIYVVANGYHMKGIKYVRF